jgi:flagellar basal-body rod protein FlgB
MGAIGANEVTAALERSLPVLEASQRVLANNVANANTPNFVPTRVSFEDSLRQAIHNGAPLIPLKRTHERHLMLQAQQPALVAGPDVYTASRTDQSKFDVDREMVELLKNSSRYDIFSSILRDRYQQTREVLRMP